MKDAEPPTGSSVGGVADARPAASLILLRDADRGPEVLLVRRNPEASFMGGAWVFPGGAVDDGEDHVRTALRELEEEAGLRIADEQTPVPFSRWITPAEVKTRFDTRFFLARAPDGAQARPDGEECVAARWMRASDALEEHRRSELTLVFPTIKHLEQLAEFASVDEALENARRRDVRPIQPRVIVEGDSARVVLPGEPGYDD